MKPTVIEKCRIGKEWLTLPKSGTFTQSGYHVWCGSLARSEDGSYHLFYSRWLRRYGFDAWVSHSEIARAVSSSATGPFEFVETVLPARGETFWDGHCTHNVTVQYFEGNYFLYYMGNRGDRRVDPKGLNWVHRNNQRIGVAVASSPEGPWERFDRPLVDTSDDSAAPDSLVVSNPTVTARPEGGYLMIFKAVGSRDPLPFGGPVVHLAATASSPLGPFTVQTGPLFSLPGVRFPVEDPFLWFADGYYNLIMKDMDSHFCEEPLSLVRFSSQDGFDWDYRRPRLFTTRRVVREESGEACFDRLERPQIYFEDGVPRIFCCATLQGETTAVLQIPL